MKTFKEMSQEERINYVHNTNYIILNMFIKSGNKSGFINIYNTDLFNLYLKQFYAEHGITFQKKFNRGKERLYLVTENNLDTKEICAKCFDYKGWAQKRIQDNLYGSSSDDNDIINISDLTSEDWIDWLHSDKKTVERLIRNRPKRVPRFIKEKFIKHETSKPTISDKEWYSLPDSVRREFGSKEAYINQSLPSEVVKTNRPKPKKKK